MKGDKIMKNQKKYILFVYGTLMKNKRAHDLLGNSKSLGDAFIKGYKKIDMFYYPGIVVCENEKVEGEAYIIDEETKRKVDVYEGEGYLFKCVDVDIYVNQIVLKGIVYEYILQNEK